MKTESVSPHLFVTTLLMCAAFGSVGSAHAIARPTVESSDSAKLVATNVDALDSIDHWEAATRIKPTNPMLSSSLTRVSSLDVALLLLNGNDGDDHDRDYDHYNDHDHYRDRHRDRDRDPAPMPTPEPVTALLFGTAMLIGGGILRRRHRAGQN